MGFLQPGPRALLRQKVTELMTALVQLKRAQTAQAEVAAANAAGEILIDILFGLAWHARYGTVRPPNSPNSSSPPQA